MKTLTEEALQECKERPKYIFCFICLLVSRLMNVLFAVYIQLWVMSFQKSGLLASKKESDAIYRNIVIGSQAATLVSLPLFGYFADKGDARIIIPFSFVIRCAVCISFRFVEDPSEWYSYALCVALVMTSLI